MTALGKNEDTITILAIFVSSWLCRGPDGLSRRQTTPFDWSSRYREKVDPSPVLLADRLVWEREDPLCPEREDRSEMAAVWAGQALDWELDLWEMKNLGFRLTCFCS